MDRTAAPGPPGRLTRGMPIQLYADRSCWYSLAARSSGQARTLTITPETITIAMTCISAALAGSVPFPSPGQRGRGVWVEEERPDREGLGVITPLPPAEAASGSSTSPLPEPKGPDGAHRTVPARCRRARRAARSTDPPVAAAARGRLPRRHPRLCATVVSGEFRIGWEFLLLDIPLVAVTATTTVWPTPAPADSSRDLKPARAGGAITTCRGTGSWQTPAVAIVDDTARRALVRRGLALEYGTLCWNVAGIVVLAIAAISARSVALAGFGLDSLIEIGASAVVIWELSGTGQRRQRRALRLIGYAFAALAGYLLVQSTVVLAAGYHPRHSALGIAWTAVTAAAMVALAAGKARTGRALDSRVLRTEGRVTLIDAILAAAVLLGLALNAALSWWWADPAAGYVLVCYAAREVREIFAGDHWPRLTPPLRRPISAARSSSTGGRGRSG